VILEITLLNNVGATTFWRYSRLRLNFFSLQYGTPKMSISLSFEVSLPSNGMSSQHFFLNFFYSYIITRCDVHSNLFYLATWGRLGVATFSLWMRYNQWCCSQCVGYSKMSFADVTVKRLELIIQVMWLRWHASIILDAINLFNTAFVPVRPIFKVIGPKDTAAGQIL